jgi:Mg2+ and Co2+ transporter CorA
VGVDAAGVDPAVGHALHDPDGGLLSAPETPADVESDFTGFKALLEEPGVIWTCCPTEGGFRVAHDLPPDRSGFCWLHLNLADERTHGWLQRQNLFPPEVTELLVSREHHPQAIAEGNSIGLVFQDFEREFDRETGELGSLHLALCPDMMVTGRYHPVQTADAARRRLDRRGSLTLDDASALTVLLDSASSTFSTMARQLNVDMQAADDRFHSGRTDAAADEVRDLRRRAARVIRVTSGLGAALHRLEDLPELSDDIEQVVTRFAQRMDGINSDIIAIQAQIRALREEFDLIAAQKTNSNLYFLSVMSALLLPATLVTGFFGMNTGGLPFAQESLGTLSAGVLAVITSAATWVLLHRRR